jgi:hypothetical protein
MVAEEYQHAIKFGHQSNRSRWLALRRPIDSIVAYRLKNARLNRFARGEFPDLVLRSTARRQSVGTQFDGGGIQNRSPRPSPHCIR